MSLGATSACLTVTAVGALISYIPAGIFAEKVGRHGDSKPVSRKGLEAFDVDD